MLDFSSQKKNFLPLTFASGEKVLLKVPKKALFTKLSEIRSSLEKSEEVEEVYNELLQTTAEIISTNMSDKKFTADEVDELFDIEDMAFIIAEYQKFAYEAINRPN